MLTLEEIKALEDKNQELTKENTALKALVKESDDKLTEANKSLADTQSKLSTYEALGESSELDSVIEEAITTIGAYKEFGTVEELKEQKTAHESLVVANAELVQKFSAYEEFGTVETLGKAKTILESFVVVGKTAEEVTASLEELTSYQAIGTVDELSKIKEELTAKETQLKVESIASKFDITLEAATATLNLHGMDEEQAVTYLGQFMKPRSESKPGAKPDIKEVKKNEDGTPSKKDILGAVLKDFK